MHRIPVYYALYFLNYMLERTETLQEYNFIITDHSYRKSVQSNAEVSGGVLNVSRSHFV